MSSASLIRLYRTDIRPVSFATGYDNVILITCLVVSFLFVHLMALVYLIITSKTRFVLDYFTKDQLLIGFLLDMWVIGFNSISHAIWWQFEQRELSVPDDYEMLILGNDDNTNQGKEKDGNKEMYVVTLPGREGYHLASKIIAE